ncbi:MAG: haloacid dehalogenase-like hydrolase [Candidatus Bathyarchaeota archaeon]|nr:haloacid dehalogenase-like hydrolase [Candidatus Bathyarchaeota archaeon]
MTTPNRGKTKLAVFDVEGVLVPRNRLFLEVGKSMGFVRLMKLLFFGLLYEIGLITIKQVLTRSFLNMKGINVDLFFQALETLPFMPCTIEAFAALKAQGRKTALISAGLPTFLVEKVAAKVGADYAVGVEAGVKNNVLTGEVWGNATEPNGKFLVLKDIMEKEHVTAAECAVIADDRNNSSMFLKEALKIGYNPDFVLRVKADVVVTGRLTKLLPEINREPKKRTLPTRRDLLREFIHGSGFFIPILAILFGVPAVAVFTCTVIAFYCVSEFARVKGTNIPFFSFVTRHAASLSELREFTLAPLYFAFGILLTLLLFPAPASYAGIAIFALGDSTASIVGGTIAKNPLHFNKSKTLEGTLAGFFFAFLAACAFVPPWIALIGAAIGMTVEYLPLPINDNLLMPLSTGLVLMFIV